MAGASPSAADLKAAIDRREVIPYFQPIVELRSGRLWGFEMLARWQHPQYGFVPPDKFIDLAEKSQLMEPLSDLLLEQACTSLAPSFPEHLTLSVNITPNQMHDCGLSARILTATQYAGFKPRQLVVEITETALLSDLETPIAIAKDLKQHGVRLALDDFGTGYSSLRYLNSLPLDEIKIDQSFVRSMNDQRESRKITAAVAGLGQSLGLIAIAEGIEDKVHADMLFYMGCELGQGYFYSRPVPFNEVHALIAKDALSAPPSSPLLASDMAANLEVAPALRLAQLQAIYDYVPLGLCFLDRDLRYISINKQFEEMLPSPPQPRLGKAVKEIAPLIFPRLEPYLRRALAGEPVYNLEVPYPSGKHPSEFNTFLMFCQPVLDEANEVVGISVALKDITAQKRAENELHEQKEHYQRPLELSPSYPFVADVQGNISWTGHQGLTASQPTDLLGRGWHNVVHPDDLSAVEEQWASDVRMGAPHDFQFRIRTANGEWHRVRSRAYPRRGDNGEITGWYGLVEDIDHPG
jgi:PAS domain S-box-containing protein